MTLIEQVRSQAQEPDVRAAIVAALSARGAQVATEAPGSLVVDIGSVGRAYLAGGFRSATKMPIRVQVTMGGDPDGTDITVQVGSRSTGGGYWSGGVLGMMKEKKAERSWMETVLNAVPATVGTRARKIPRPPPPPPTRP